MYRIAFSTSRKSVVRGRPNLFTGGSNGMIKFHSPSFWSLA